MSAFFESVRLNAYVRRPYLVLCSHPKELWGNGVRSCVSSKGKIPSTREKITSEEDGTHDVASSRTMSPTHYQRAILAHLNFRLLLPSSHPLPPLPQPLSPTPLPSPTPSTPHDPILPPYRLALPFIHHQIKLS